MFYILFSYTADLKKRNALRKAEKILLSLILKKKKAKGMMVNFLLSVDMYTPYKTTTWLVVVKVLPNVKYTLVVPESHIK